MPKDKSAKLEAHRRAALKAAQELAKPLTADETLAAAKVLEAAGCYIRRNGGA